MNEVMLEYTDLDSPVHKLTGATKLICLILWAFASMITYDTRILAFMVIAGLVIFKISKVKFKQVSFVFYFILVFLLINNIAIFLLSPLEGVETICRYKGTIILSFKHNFEIFFNNTYSAFIYGCYKSK